MNTTQDIRGPLLNAECEAVLIQHDAYAEPLSYDAAFAAIRDEEGTRILTVTIDIGPLDLLAAFNARVAGYQRGLSDGKEAARAQMRRALGMES